MTVNAILEAKGREIVSVNPDAKLSEAIRMLAERRIGAVLVMQGYASRRHPVGARHRARARRTRRRSVDEPVSAAMTRKVTTCSRADTVAI